MRETAGLRRHLRPGLPLDEDVDQGLATQSALSGIGMLLQGLVRFLYNVVIKWGFGTVGLVLVGRVNTCIAVALLGSLLVPLAASNAVAKHLARLRGSGDLDAMRGVVAHLSRITWATSLVVGALAAGYVAARVEAPWQAAALTGVLAVAYSSYTFTRGTLLGLGLLTRATLWDLVASVTAVVGVVVLVALHASAWLLAPLAICYAIYALGSIAPVRGPRLDDETRHEVTAFMRISLVQTIATAGFLQGSQLAAQHWGDPAATGHYALALSLATPASLVARSLQTVLFPRMAGAHGRGDHALLARQTDQATRALLLLCVVVYGAIILLTPTILRVLYGADAVPAAPTLVLLLVASLVQNVVIASTDNLMSRELRWNRLVRDLAVAGALAGVVVWLALGPVLGVVGVAVGFLVGVSITSLVPVAVAWRLDAQPWGGLTLRFAVVVVALCLAAAWIIRSGAGVWVQVAATLLLVTGWLTASSPDVRAALAARRR